MPPERSGPPPPRPEASTPPPPPRQENFYRQANAPRREKPKREPSRAGKELLVGCLALVGLMVGSCWRQSAMTNARQKYLAEQEILAAQATPSPDAASNA
jgi:hypothetical protein